MSWRQRGSLWTLQPPDPQGRVDFIGGSYLAATPQLSYRRLLEALARQGLEVWAWSYVPGFDHQAQANEAWKLLRLAREQKAPLATLRTLHDQHRANALSPLPLVHLSLALKAMGDEARARQALDDAMAEPRGAPDVKPAPT